ncbi:hypothetical protein BC827DRAFT_300286 [Russula dissimulans]|nr:hypothetical protein BC827DRAFT_300286 [Russula dissimulans]
MVHLESISHVEWQRLWNGDLGGNLKEPSMNAMHFYFFSLQARGTVIAQLSHQSWPFKLITKCESMGVTDQLRKYEPRSDLLILKSSLPRLLIEINSKPRRAWPEDLIRMFLTGAAVVPFANTFLDAFKKEKNFVLFAMYVWDNGQVSRYSLFQESPGPAVYYNETKYSLNDLVGRAKFVRELYNFSHMLESEGDTKDMNVKLTEFKVKIDQHDAKHPMKSFFTKDDQGTNNNNGGEKRRLDKDVGDGSVER